jgi:hypothetical protein
VDLRNGFEEAGEDARSLCVMCMRAGRHGDAADGGDGLNIGIPLFAILAVSPEAQWMGR